MKCLSCAFYRGYYYIIVYWFTEIFRSICEIFLNESEKSNLFENNNKKEFAFEEELLKIIYLNISDLLIGFLVLYTEINMKLIVKRKETKKPKKTNTLESSLIYNDISYEKKHKLGLLLLMSIVDIIASSLYLLTTLIDIKRVKQRQLDWLLSFDIISRIFFSILFLKINVREHHKLSIVLCIIGCILMSVSDIMSIIKEEYSIMDIIIFMSIIFPKSILFPLADVLNKILLTSDFFLPHSLIFSRGIIQFGILLIIIPILYLNGIIDLDYFIYMNDIKTKIIFSILFVFISCVRNFCLMNVIYIFNSHYVSYLYTIIIIDNTIRQFILDDKIYNFHETKGIIIFVIDIIGLLLISFGTMIFNEMIIINCCNLNEKTKIGLLNKEKIENEESFDSIYYPDEDETEEENESEKRNKSINWRNNTSGINKEEDSITDESF